LNSLLHVDNLVQSTMNVKSLSLSRSFRHLVIFCGSIIFVSSFKNLCMNGKYT